jgi:pyrophosphate--fructose-6-phosphate 1-phosphotransferase
MVSLLQQKRLAYEPPLPPLLQDLNQTGTPRKLNVGALFSGGPAAGGHNVLAGLFDGLLQIHKDSTLLGFLGGPSGLIENKYKKLESSMIDSVRNMGGFDLIGSGRTKIETLEQFQAAKETVMHHRLDAVLIIGGDDSNTNAAFLAEYFLKEGTPCSVIGVPKTIDGDLRSKEIEISFGFDSACKTYAELIGNIARDARSSQKYYHFIRLMGRSASHITLECALLTCPNLALISEERSSLPKIVENIVNLIKERKKEGKEFGVILVPEGLIEFIPELDSHRDLFPRDPHGNVNVSQVETEKLLIDLVKKEGVSFHAVSHFLGYEGRCCFPSNFDAKYCYALGKFAAAAMRDKKTGVILALQGLRKPVSEWEPLAVSLASLMHLEVRSGKEKLVIAKTLVDLHGNAFSRFAKERASWRLGDFYRMPGPIQFFGDIELTDSIPVTL